MCIVGHPGLWCKSLEQKVWRVNPCYISTYDGLGAAAKMADGGEAFVGLSYGVFELTLCLSPYIHCVERWASM